MFKFKDGVKNFFNAIVNTRSALTQNEFTSCAAMDDEEKRAIYKSGIGSKIVRIKASNALDDTIQFKNTDQEEVYKEYLEEYVDLAAKHMIGFGRGILVIFEDKNAILSKRLDRSKVSFSNSLIKNFSGDSVHIARWDSDLSSPTYKKPLQYMVNGITIDSSRVIDFTYYKPSDFDAVHYRFGGMSEFELIKPQLIADGIVERATPTILERNSTMFYKVKGFKEMLSQGKEQSIINYFTCVENARSIYGAGIMDAEDEIQEISQVLANLSEADQITLRRLAMVTGIPVNVLVGESVKGMNSTGDTEMLIFQDMIETIQKDYLVKPINKLMSIFNLDKIKFKENQGETPLVRAEYDAKVIDNAFKLYQMGENYNDYLVNKGIITRDDPMSFFPEDL